MCHDSTSQLAFVDSSAAIYPGQNQWTRGCGVGNQPNLPARPLFFPASIPNERTSFETGQATNGPWEGELYYLSIAETENPSYISTLPLFSCTAVFFLLHFTVSPSFPISVVYLLPGTFVGIEKKGVEPGGQPSWVWHTISTSIRARSLDAKHARRILRIIMIL